MGGTFNPIHNAHLLIAFFAREEFCLDKVIFMTGGNTPHKKAEGAEPEERLEMVKRAVADNRYFEVSDFEVKKQSRSYTVETLEYLKEEYPGSDFYFIVGSDSLNYMDKWYKCEKIFRLCTVLIFDRKGFAGSEKKRRELEVKYSAQIRRIDIPIPEISSSEIRKRIAAGKSVENIVPGPVIDYIKEKGLYEGQRGI